MVGNDRNQISTMNAEYIWVAETFTVHITGQWKNWIRIVLVCFWHDEVGLLLEYNPKMQTVILEFRIGCLIHTFEGHCLWIMMENTLSRIQIPREKKMAKRDLKVRDKQSRRPEGWSEELLSCSKGKKIN